MCDILCELSQLSLELQKHEITLIQADGIYFTEAVKTKQNMLFKNVILYNNNKLNCINKTQLITSAVNNLNLRLIENRDEEIIIIQDFQIVNKKTWPIEVDIRFGENEVRRICERFVIN